MLEQARLKVVAPCEQSDANDLACDVIDCLASLPVEFQASAAGFKALFQLYASGRKLTTSMFHLANEEEKIWEFRKGRLRVFCFQDGRNQLVLLTNIILKKTPKAPKKAVKAAIDKKNRYLDAVRNGDIEYLEMPNEPMWY